MKELKGIFPHANTIVSIEDGKLLKQFQYNLLHNSQGLQAALAKLNEMNYFNTYKNANADNYGILLDGLMKDTVDLIAEISPKEPIWRIFALLYDIHNMKLVAKEKFFGKRLDDLALRYGSYSLRTIRSAAVNESDNILDNEVLTGGFFEALGSDDIYDVDFILDRAYFKTLRKLAEGLESPGIVNFIVERVDLFNISVFFQSLAMGAPEGYFSRAFSDSGSQPRTEWDKYAGGDSLDEFEGFPLWQKYRAAWGAAGKKADLTPELDVLIDNYLIGKTKVCKLMAFGIEPICAYFYNKFMEIKNVRILLAGKANSYGDDEIRKRMRIPYEL